MNINNIIALLLALILIGGTGAIVMNGFDDQFSLLRYCNDIGYDGYVDISGFLESSDHYCYKEFKEGNIIIDTIYQDIEDDINDGCWFWCELDKIDEWNNK